MFIYIFNAIKNLSKTIYQLGMFSDRFKNISLIPVCMNMCVRSLYFIAKPSPQISHVCRWISECINRWRFNFLLLIKPLPHT